MFFLDGIPTTVILRKDMKALVKGFKKRREVEEFTHRD
jgi:hypothetical protein